MGLTRLLRSHHGLSATASALDRLAALENEAQTPSPVGRDEYCHQLTEDGLWWDACHEAVHHRSEQLRLWTSDLQDRGCWAVRTIDDASNPVSLRALGAADDRLSPAARRMLQVAQLARLIAEPQVDDETASQMLGAMVNEWSTANMLPTTGIGGGLPGPAANPAAGRLVDLLAHLAGGAARTFIAWQVMLLTSPGTGRTRSRRRDSIKVLFESLSDDSGLSGTLHMQISPDGPAGLFPDPRTMTTLNVDDHFGHSVTAAWESLTRGRRNLPCVVWQLELDGGRIQSIRGESLGAAFAVLLAEIVGSPVGNRSFAVPGARAAARVALKWFRVARDHHAITGAVTYDGKLAKVSGMKAKLAKAKKSRLRVVAPDKNKNADEQWAEGVKVAWVPDIAAARRELYRTSRIRVLSAATAFSLFVAGIVGAVAYQQHQDAQQQSQIALSRQLVADAQAAEGQDPALARQLLAVAYSVSPTAEARGALLTALAIPGSIRVPRSISSPYGAALTYSPDSRYLVAGIAGAVRIYELSTGKLIARLPSYFGEIGAVAFSPDGRLLAVGDGFGSDGEAFPGALRVWDVSNPARSHLLASVKSPWAIGSISFSPDGKQLATQAGLDKPPRLWNMSNPSRPVEYPDLAPGHKINGSLTFDSDGRTMLNISDSGMLTLWDLTKSGHIIHPFVLPGRHLTGAFSSDGQVLAVPTAGGGIELWHVAGPGKPRQLDSLDTGLGSVSTVTFVGSSGRMLLAMNGTEAGIWDVTNPTNPNSLGTFTPPGGLPIGDTLTASPNGRMLATCTDDGLVRLWNIADPTPAGALSAVEAPATAHLVGDPMVRPGAWTVMTDSMGDAGGQVIDLWNLSDPNRPRLLSKYSADQGAAAVSSDGNILAVSVHTSLAAAATELLDISHPRSLKLLYRIAGLGADALAFSPVSRTLVTSFIGGTDIPTYHQAYELWNVADPRRPRLLSRFDEAPGMMGSGTDTFTFSPDGRFLSTKVVGRGIHVWDVSDPTRPVSLGIAGSRSDSTYYNTFTSDSRSLIAASESGVWRIWNVTKAGLSQRGSVLIVSPTHSAGGIALSPDGTLAAIEDSDSVRVWDISNLGQQPVLLAELKVSGIISFSPDGNTLAMSNGGIQMWDMNFADIARRLCEGVGTPMTVDQWNQYLPGEAFAPPCGR